LASDVHYLLAAGGIDTMQAQQSNTGDERAPAASILDQETADIKVMIDEIWRRFTVRAMEMRRSGSEFRIDSPANQ
jgi:hypothetical protein